MARAKAKAKAEATVETIDGPAVEVLPIDTLTNDPANVRRRDEKATRRLSASLRRFGAARSIVIDGKGVVRAGNGTMDAAKSAGVRRVVVVDADGETLVAVRRKDWTPSEATAYAIADNQLGELATFDVPSLVTQLDALVSEGFDLEPIGFDAKELDQLAERTGGVMAGGDEKPTEATHLWGVVIECDDETQQVELLEQMIGEGYKCRALMS